MVEARLEDLRLEDGDVVVLRAKSLDTFILTVEETEEGLNNADFL